MKHTAEPRCVVHLLSCPPSHRWAVPLKLHLAIDATGNTKGNRSRYYTRHTVSDLVAETSITVTVVYLSGSELPELTIAIARKNSDNDAHFRINMPNYGCAQ